MSNMPGALLEPMSIDERIYFLESMKNDKSRYEMLDSSKVTVPDFMQIILLNDGTTIVSCITKQKQFCCILRENGLCTAFEDFISSLNADKMIVSSECFAADIDECINYLKSIDVQ